MELINEIKKDLDELKELSPALGESLLFEQAQHLLNRLAEFQRKAPKRFNSLIELVEQQQKKMEYKDSINRMSVELIEDREKEISEKDTLIESQKAENVNLKDLVLESNKMYTEISLRESDNNDLIKSQKEEIEKLQAELKGLNSEKWNGSH
jgi:hypothetical protein